MDDTTTETESETETEPDEPTQFSLTGEPADEELSSDQARREAISLIEESDAVFITGARVCGDESLEFATGQFADDDYDEETHQALIRAVVTTAAERALALSQPVPAASIVAAADLPDELVEMLMGGEIPTDPDADDSEAGEDRAFQ